MWRFRLNTYSISSLAIDADGTIYLGDDSGTVYAVNPDGTEKWRFRTMSERIFTSGVTINADGTIYIGTTGTSGGNSFVYALNPDGTEKWRFNAGWHVYGAPAIDDDGTIYFGSRDGNFYALNPQGQVLWRFPAYYFPVPPAIGHDGRIYAAMYAGSPNWLYCLDRNGNEVWRTSSGWAFGGSAVAHDGYIYSQNESTLMATSPDGATIWQSQALRGYGGPCIGRDGTVYACGWESLTALTPGGKVIWSVPIRFDFDSPIVDAEGTVYAMRYAIRADGTIKWTLNEGMFHRSRPAMGPDGTLYVIGWDTLYAIGPGRGRAETDLRLSGECPGAMEATVTYATPHGRVAFIRSGFNGCLGGSTLPPGGPCAGTVLPIGGAALLRVVAADAEGIARLSGLVPGIACGHICLIALDLTTCRMSNVGHF